MGRSSKLKKDRRIIKDRVDKMFEDVQKETDEHMIFKKLGEIQNFNYLIKEDKDTENNYMYKIITKRISEYIVDNIMTKGIESNKERFDKIFQDKKFDDDISLRNVALFSMYLNEKAVEIRDYEQYKEAIEKLNETETSSKVVAIARRNRFKEIPDLKDDEKDLVVQQFTYINKVMEMLNNEIISIGNEIVDESKKYGEIKNPTFEEAVYMSYVSAFVNGLFRKSVEEVENYNKILELLNNLLGNKSEKKEKKE